MPSETILSSINSQSKFFEPMSSSLIQMGIISLAIIFAFLSNSIASIHKLIASFLPKSFPSHHIKSDINKSIEPNITEENNIKDIVLYNNNNKSTDLNHSEINASSIHVDNRIQTNSILKTSNAALIKTISTASDSIGPCSLFPSITVSKKSLNPDSKTIIPCATDDSFALYSLRNTENELVGWDVNLSNNITIADGVSVIWDNNGATTINSHSQHFHMDPSVQNQMTNQNYAVKPSQNVLSQQQQQQQPQTSFQNLRQQELYENFPNDLTQTAHTLIKPTLYHPTNQNQAQVQSQQLQLQQHQLQFISLNSSDSPFNGSPTSSISSTPSPSSIPQDITFPKFNSKFQPQHHDAFGDSSYTTLATSQSSLSNSDSICTPPDLESSNNTYSTPDDFSVLSRSFSDASGIIDLMEDLNTTEQILGRSAFPISTATSVSIPATCTSLTGPVSALSIPFTQTPTLHATTNTIDQFCNSQIQSNSGEFSQAFDLDLDFDVGITMQNDVTKSGTTISPVTQPMLTEFTSYSQSNTQAPLSSSPSTNFDGNLKKPWSDKSLLSLDLTKGTLSDFSQQTELPQFQQPEQSSISTRQTHIEQLQLPQQQKLTSSKPQKIKYTNMPVQLLSNIIPFSTPIFDNQYTTGKDIKTGYENNINICLDQLSSPEHHSSPSEVSTGDGSPFSVSDTTGMGDMNFSIHSSKSEENIETHGYHCKNKNHNHGTGLEPVGIIVGGTTGTSSAVIGRDYPFVCPHCSASFRIRGYLTRHMKKHAMKKAYSCPFFDCEEKNPCHPTGGFSRRDTYKTHLKARHFLYPPGTRSENRSKVGGTCRGCGTKFDSNERWVEEHIHKKQCPGLPHYNNYK